jgi:hypothetical protein
MPAQSQRAADDKTHSARGHDAVMVAPHLSKIYPVHAKTRKSFGEMTRKLSVTESR